MMAGRTPTRKWCVDSLVTGNVKYFCYKCTTMYWLTISKNVFVRGCLSRRFGETLLSEGLDITPVPRFGVGSGPILLDDVSCTGKEPSLTLCNRREWLRHDCTHHEDVNIACSPERSAESLPTSKTSFHFTVRPAKRRTTLCIRCCGMHKRVFKVRTHVGNL